jgi:hypothetical protein
MPTAVAWGKLSSDNRTLELMHRYESHFSREYRRTLREFKAYRSGRLSREQPEKIEMTERTEPGNAEATSEERDTK